ncbi:MAG: pilus assembly protein TadG-related protein [Terracidiphilus sp.]
MRILKEEDGQVMALTLLASFVLLAFLGLAIDVGMMFHAKRNTQIAADAAAAAAALDYKYNGSTSSAVTQGRDASSVNGVTNGTSGAVVTINIPPASGPEEGSSGFIEAIVQNPTPTAFMSVFGFKSINVEARAVAGVGSSAGCLWTLARSGLDVSLTGSGAISAPKCDIYDDSSATDALSLTGSGSITANEVGIVGSYSTTGSGRITPSPVTGMAPAADPLASLPAPTIPTGTCSGGSCTKSFTGSTNNSIGPGTYTSISNTGSGTLTLTAGNYIINGSLTNTGSGGLILGAGNYTITGNFTNTGSGTSSIGAGLDIVEGNLSLTGSGPLTVTGVTFYTEGSTTVTGSSTLSLTAPTSGADSGVLFFQARSDSSAVQITGSSGSTIQGIVYAPAAPLTLTGSGSMTVSLDVIVDSLKETGSGTIAITNYANVTNTNSVLGKMVMVE